MYVAIELATRQDGTFSVSTYKKETKDEVEAAYHSILAVAAKSNNLIHAATILNEEGQKLKSECYKHDPEPQPETEKQQAGE